MTKTDIRIVILDCPIEQWDNPLVQKIFQRTIALKVSGYRSRFGEESLPIDTTDFIGTHVLTCIYSNNDLFPVMGNRSVTSNRAAHYGIPFPLEELFKKCDSQLHLEGFKAFSKNTKRNMRYFGSWTGDMKLKKENPKLFEELFQIFYASQIFSCPDSINTEIFTCANLIFKTEKHIEYLGYKRFEYKNEVLPPFNVAYVKNNPCTTYLMRDGYSKQAIENAKKFSQIINKSIILQTSKSVDNCNYETEIQIPMAA